MHLLLQKAWNKRKRYIEANKINAFRLTTKEELNLPIAVDIYQNLERKVAILQIYQPDIDQNALRNLKGLLKSEFKIEEFFEKKRFQVEKKDIFGGNLKEKADEIVVDEYGQKFIINLNNYLDTGLFLDHRETRKMVKEFCENFLIKNKRKATILNLFAYTGSFSVYACKGNAEMTHTVDLSKTYCDWARRNLDLNNCLSEKNWIYKMDIFEFYKYAKKKDLSFDLIIIDPPTFARNKDINFSVQRDHRKLILEASKLLKNDSNNGGKIIFSNNCLEFVLARDLREKFRVKNIQKETIPVDFYIEKNNLNSKVSKKATFINQIHNAFLIEK